MEGNSSPMTVIDRRKPPVIPPPQTLVMYLVVVIIVTALNVIITERNERQIRDESRRGAYDRCLAGNFILENGNQQAATIREILRTLRDNRAATNALETDPVKHRLGVAAIKKYETLEASVKDYPTFECHKDGTSEPT